MPANVTQGFERPPTVQQAVRTEILRRIAYGEVPVGELLRPETLAKDLGMSAATVREALKMLVGMGVLSYEPHRGHRLRAFNMDELIQIFDILILLESDLLKKSVGLVNDDDLERVKRQLEDSERLEPHADIVAYRKANVDFHRTILETAKMEFFVEQIDLVRERAGPYRALIRTSDVIQEQLRHDHRTIFEALCARDTALVVLLNERHRLQEFTRLRDSLSDFMTN